MTSPHGVLPRTDDTSYPARRLLQCIRPVGIRILRRHYALRLHGVAHVPDRGPVILAANHVGVIDGPLLTMVAPRPVHALTKIEMFRGVLGCFLVRSGQIPLDRFRTDPAAVKQSIRVLRDGGVVGIFPEGARGSGELELFHRGAAYLALVTGAPIVPVILFGTREPGGHCSSLPRRGGAIDVVFSAPFTLPVVPWPRTRQQVGDASWALRARMLDDLQQAHHSTGLTLPGPLPEGEHEPDPGGGVTEKSA